jgi:hypothetical protein
MPQKLPSSAGDCKRMPGVLAADSGVKRGACIPATRQYQGRRGCCLSVASLLVSGLAGAAAASAMVLGCLPAHRAPLCSPTLQDADTQVLWWVLMGCDPTAWRPSPAEATETGVEASWAKNRNMHLRWEAMEAVLRQVWADDMLFCFPVCTTGVQQSPIGLGARRPELRLTCCHAAC